MVNVGNRRRVRSPVLGVSPLRARREITPPTLTPSSTAMHLAASSTSSSMVRVVRTSRAYRRRAWNSRFCGRMSVSVLSLRTKAVDMPGRKQRNLAGGRVRGCQGRLFLPARARVACSLFATDHDGDDQRLADVLGRADVPSQVADRTRKSTVRTRHYLHHRSGCIAGEHTPKTETSNRLLIGLMTNKVGR